MAPLYNHSENRVFPILEEVCGKDPVTPLLRTADLFREDQEYFAAVIDDLKSRFRKAVMSGLYGMPVSLLMDTPRSVSSRLVRRMYTDAFGAGTDLESVHVSAILGLASGGEGGRELSLPHGRRCLLSGGYLYFYGQDVCGDAVSGLSPGDLLLTRDAEGTQSVADEVLERPVWLAQGLPPGTYYVHIQVKSASGLQSEFSPPRKITVNPALLDGSGLPVRTLSGTAIQSP